MPSHFRELQKQLAHLCLHFISNYKCLINKTQLGNECVPQSFSIFNGAADHGVVLI